MPSPSPALLAVTVLVGPGLELLAGPAIVTGGWARGHGALDRWPVMLAGGALVVVGVVLVAGAVLALAGRGGGTLSPAAPTTRLVTAGAYGLLRHPMYAGTTIAIAGQGLLIARPILLLAAAAYGLTTSLLAVREERALARRHGGAHVGYVRAVPALRPRWRARR